MLRKANLSFTILKWEDKNLSACFEMINENAFLLTDLFVSAEGSVSSLPIFFKSHFKKRQ